MTQRGTESGGRAEINGTTIWYEVQGDGPPLLVCHGGLGVDHTLYRGTMQHLATHHQVVWYDQRGNGLSGRPPRDSITVEQLADDAAALLVHLGLNPAIVLGHSYGGFVAQELALRHPEAVAALVLVATGPGQLGSGEVENEDGEPPPMPAELAQVFAQVPDSDDAMRDVFRSALPFYVHRFDVAQLQANFDAVIVSADTMLRGFEVLASWSSVDRLHAVTSPTLVVGGKADPVMTWPQQVRIAKRVPGAQLALLEQCSHFVWLDDPERFWSIVDEFLAAGR